MKEIKVPGLGLVEVEDDDIDAFSEFLSEKGFSSGGAVELEKMVKGIAEVNKGISQLGDLIKSLPEPKVEVKPTDVNLPAPVVNIPASDFAPIIKAVEGLKGQMGKIKIPEIKNHPKPVVEIEGEITETDYRGFGKKFKLKVKRG